MGNSTEVGFQSATEFTVGSVLSRTMLVLLKKPVLFFGLTLIAFIPAIIIGVIALNIGSITSLLKFTFLAIIITYVLILILQGAIAYGVFRVLSGENTGFGNAFSRSVDSIVTLVCLSYMLFACISAGYILLIIPGIIINCALVASVPVCVVERRGVFECMGRSAELTKGYRLKIFVLLLIMWVISFIISKVVFAIFGTDSVVTTIICIIILAIPQTYRSVMASIIYYDLRTVKEGVSVDALAKAFD